MKNIYRKKFKDGHLAAITIQSQCYINVTTTDKLIQCVNQN